VLIDTNVILDYAEKREGFYGAARKVFETIKQMEMVSCMSASAVTDVFYLLQKHRKDPVLAMSLLKKLLRHLEVIGVDRRTIDTAIESGMLDFEDAVQTAAAQDFGINIVITRDKDGFSDSGLKVYTPEQFLDVMK
jgi:predicted nucleic acid-binding protein